MRHRYFSPPNRSLLRLVIIASLIFAACNSDPDATIRTDVTPLAVSAYTVRYETLPEVEDVIGTIRARVHAAVEAKTSSKIEKLNARLGQEVKQGQILVELDTRELKARVEQAQAVRDQAAREAKRRSDLVARGAVSVQQAEEAVSGLRVAEASLKEAQTMLGYAQLQAPFEGVISKVLVDVGDLAMPGKVLLEIDSRDEFRLECGVPELVVSHLKIVDAVPVHIPALSLTVSGTVDEISPSADPATRTSLVKMKLPQSGEIRVGQYARAQIPVTASQALIIPNSAHVVRGQLEYVVVISNNKASLRLIRTGKQWNDTIEVLSGLSADEQIVKSDADKIPDGAALQVAP